MTNTTITASERAQMHIRTQLEQTESRYLRLGLKESGCNGYMYTLDFLSEPGPDDECFEVADGVRICVADADRPYVEGTEVDMVTEGLNSALVFKNPKAQSYCGCGESFALAESDAGATDSAAEVGDLATNVGSEAD